MQLSSEETLPLLNRNTLVSDMKQGFGALGKEIAASRSKTEEFFAESVKNGGPASQPQAILTLMNGMNVGMRALSVKVGVPKKLLLSMIHGRVAMPQDVFDKIHEVFRKIEPELFATETVSSKKKL